MPRQSAHNHCSDVTKEKLEVTVEASTPDVAAAADYDYGYQRGSCSNLNNPYQYQNVNRHQEHY